jgi:hypothetical protein
MGQRAGAMTDTLRASIAEIRKNEYFFLVILV